MERSVGFWKRLGASVLDGLIIFFPLFILFDLTLGWGDNHPVPNIIQYLVMLILPVLWYGYTVGKKLMGIRIVKVDGQDVGIGTMLMRFLLANILYGLTLGIGVLVSAFMVGIRDDHRSIHDFIAGTYVTEAKPGELS
ncbi:RDD family protein [Halobacillus sp. A1]|uniref:RDD family protein n=1 Tax=Halobacillus campisalis TaxID=435909 RepID=A0ABW2K632_9BACI|nr:MULTISPECIES: RDD family protein [Halobacillus]MCP3031765.1 RDD family protein [Halobacillus sp. A1]